MFRHLAGIAVLAAALASSASYAQTRKETLTIDLPQDAATLDPQLQWNTDSYSIYRNIFSNLVTRDADGKIVPQIATSWKYDGDKTLVFQIRDGVTFQDGSKLTAEDVAFSINRIIDPEFQSPQLSQFNQIDNAKVSGDHEVTVTTKSPYPALLAQLVKLSIVPKAYVEKVGNDAFNQKPIGSGAYELSSWKKGVEVDLKAYDGYWGDQPSFENVVFRAVPDASTRIADLRTGKADLIRDVPPDQADTLKNAADTKVLSVPTERVGYMYLNTEATPTQKLKVRKAIAHAIDRKGLIDALLMGYAEPVNVVGAPPVFGYTDKVDGYDYDPEKAKELVKEAGAEGAKIEFLTSPSYNQTMVQAIQQMLNEVDLDVEITMTDQASFLKRRQGPAADAGSIAIGAWSCACQDADGIIYPLFRSGSTWAKYDNPAYDKLVDDARSTLDKQKRLEDYRKAYEILREDVPGIGLYQAYAIYGANQKLQWQPTANESMFVKDMSWKD